MTTVGLVHYIRNNVKFSELQFKDRAIFVTSGQVNHSIIPASSLYLLSAYSRVLKKDLDI